MNKSVVFGSLLAFSCVTYSSEAPALWWLVAKVANKVVSPSKSKVVSPPRSNVYDYSQGRTFATYPKRNDPKSNRSNKYGPKKD